MRQRERRRGNRGKKRGMEKEKVEVYQPDDHGAESYSQESPMRNYLGNRQGRKKLAKMFFGSMYKAFFKLSVHIRTWEAIGKRQTAGMHNMSARRTYDAV